MKFYLISKTSDGRGPYLTHGLSEEEPGELALYWDTAYGESSQSKETILSLRDAMGEGGFLITLEAERPRSTLLSTLDFPVPKNTPEGYVRRPGNYACDTPGCGRPANLNNPGAVRDHICDECASAPPQVTEALETLMAAAITQEMVDQERDKRKYNQPCVSCGAMKGTFIERGFHRCNACGYPGQ